MVSLFTKSLSFEKRDDYMKVVCMKVLYRSGLNFNFETSLSALRCLRSEVLKLRFKPIPVEFRENN